MISKLTKMREREERRHELSFVEEYKQNKKESFIFIFFLINFFYEIFHLNFPTYICICVCRFFFSI